MHKVTLPDYLLNFKEVEKMPSRQLLDLYMKGYYKLSDEDAMLRKLRLYAGANQT